MVNFFAVTDIVSYNAALPPLPVRVADQNLPVHPQFQQQHRRFAIPQVSFDAALVLMIPAVSQMDFQTVASRLQKPV